MKKYILLITLFCFIVVDSSAGYYAASLSHNHIQGSLYEFSLRVLKDVDTDIPTERDMIIGNDVVTLFMTSQISFDNYIEINYAGNYTFSVDGVYTIEVTIANRIVGIQNIPSSLDTPLIVRNELIVNSDIINNSNIYDFTLIDTVAVNQLFLKELSIIDTDGDSTLFKLLPSNGVSGYSFPGEPSEFSMDSISGVLTWNTPQNVGNYSVLIQIQEWRSGTLISYSEFDLLIVVDFATDIHENSTLINQVNIYPNPGNDIINFDLIDLRSKITKIEIFDVIGNRVFLDSRTHNSTISIDVSDFQSGVYFYSIGNTSNSNYLGKFIVE